MPESKAEADTFGKPNADSTNSDTGLLPVKKPDQDAFDKKEAAKKKMGGKDKAHHVIDMVCGFTLMDIIEDSCRVRFVNVWAFLLIFVFGFLSMLQLAPRVPPELKSVEFIATPPAAVIASSKRPQDRTGKALILSDTGAPKPNTNVFTEVVYFVPSDPVVPCGTADRLLLAHTLEGMRHEEVCKYNVTGSGTTNELGVAKTEKFEVSGPAGMYTLAMSVCREENASGSCTDKIRSPTHHKSTSLSNVVEMEVLKPDNLNERLFAPAAVTIGKPLETQPVVRLLGEDGEPIEGIEVVVFSNPDPVWPPMDRTAKIPNYNQRGQKLSELDCARSKKSDANGYANFTCLKVVSSTWSYVNFVFSVNAMVFLPWNDPEYSTKNLYPMEVYWARDSTKIITRVQEVRIESEAPAEVTEGDPLPKIMLSVTDQNGNGVSGVTCFALISGEGGMQYPALFRRQLVGTRNKELLNPKSTPTDENGKAIFSNLTFSIYGNTIADIPIRPDNTDDDWNITFACDGQLSFFQYKINHLKSRVAEVRIKRFLRKSAYVTTYEGEEADDGSDTFMAVVRVVDKNGNGVPGKTITPRSTEGICCPVIFPLESATESSKDSGFTVVAFRGIIGTFPTDASTVDFKVNFKVDGKFNTSESITLMKKGAVSASTCSAILWEEIYTLKPEYNISQMMAEAAISTTSSYFYDMFTKYDMLLSRPVVQSSMPIFAKMKIFTQDILTPWTLTGAGRRLGDAEEVRWEVPKNDSLRDALWLQEEREAKRSARRLLKVTDQLGTVKYKVSQAYSNKGTEKAAIFGIGAPSLLVQHEPSRMTTGSVIDRLEGKRIAIADPNLTALSAPENEASAMVMISVSGRAGVHWTQLSAEMEFPDQSTMICKSIPMDFKIINVVYQMYTYPVDSTNFPDGKVSIEQVMQGVEFMIEVILFDPEVVGEGYARIPGRNGLPLHFTADRDEPNGIYFHWVQIPHVMQNLMENSDGRKDGFFGSLNNKMWEWKQTSDFVIDEARTMFFCDTDFSHCPDDAKDGDACGTSGGTCKGAFYFANMTVTLRSKLDGTFGHFAFHFGTSGIHTNLIEFEIEEPADLDINFVQGKGFGDWVNDRLPAQTVFPANPPVSLRVTSNGKGLTGTLVSAEFQPADDQSAVRKFSVSPTYDLFKITTSWPSGFCQDPDAVDIVQDYGYLWDSPGCNDTRNSYFPSDPPSDWSGVAVMPMLGVLDGTGKLKVRFILGRNAKTPWSDEWEPEVPNALFRVYPPVEYVIYQMPPATIPLKMAMEQYATGQNKFIVHMKYSTVTSLLEYMGGATARIAIGSYQGKHRDQQNSGSLTRSLFKRDVCVWVLGLEMYGRCSPLKVEPSGTYVFQVFSDSDKFRALLGPTPTLSFEVWGLTWDILREAPTQLELVVTDLSLTALKGNDLIEMPEGMLKMGLDEQNEKCMEAAARPPINKSRTISAETKAVNANLRVPPPTIVEVGAMFLTRLQATTASGAPVRGQLIKVAVVATVAVDPKLSPGALLHQMANAGNTLSAVASPDFELLSESTLQRTNSKGVASFPLTLLKAKTGQYQLKFQVEEASATVLHTSPAFSVVNPIREIGPADNDDWVEVEVAGFQNNQTIPKQLKFKVTIAGDRSLQELVESGYMVRIHLSLKGVSPAVVKKMKQLKDLADSQAKKVAKVTTDKLQKAEQEVGKMVAQEEVAEAKETVFSRMSPELAEQCMKLPMASMADDENKTEGRPPELADAINSDPDIIDPSEQMTQFIRTITGGGARMATQASMRIEFETEIDVSDLELLERSTSPTDNSFVGVYKVKPTFPFKFVQNGEYAWIVSINGVKSATGVFKNFKAIKKKVEPVQEALDWVLTALAGITGCICLISNTTKHHFIWFVLAIAVTIVLIVVAPGMESKKTALRDNWPIVAIINSSFLLVCLFWGLGIELLTKFKADLAEKAKTKPFGERRIMYFERYTRRRFIHMLAKKQHEKNEGPYEPHPSRESLSVFIKQMVKPFNEVSAFYFPSQLWVGFFLSLFAYGYVLLQSIQMIGGVEDALNALLDKTIVATLNLIARMESEFRQVSQGAELPDAATDYMYKQMNLVRGWFESLVTVLRVGFTVGVIVAATVVILCLLATFLVFRKYALQLREGNAPFKRKDGAIVYDSMFMGQFIASTMVGFILIVLVCVLVSIPFGFNIIWEMIWSFKWYIIGSFIIPFLLNKITLILAKKIIFATDSILHRTLASIYMFWQLWLSILGGVTGAIVRFVMAMVGVIVGLPSLIFPVTPEPLNKIMLLDSPHKTFLAAVMVYHTHNHPVVIYASNCLRYFLEERKKARKAGECSEDVLKEQARKRSQRFVILLLIKHPWLQRHRKTFLLKERRKMFDEKNDKKKGIKVEDHSKPTPEEREIATAILNLKVGVQHATIKIEALHKQLSEIRGMPEGSTERAKAVEHALSKARNPLAL